MGASPGNQKQKLKLLEIPGVIISNVSCSSFDSPFETTTNLRFVVDEAGNPQLQFHRDADVGFVSCVDVSNSQVRVFGGLVALFCCMSEV